MRRNCDNCGKEYEADIRNVNRGWGLCCSKSCAAHKREKSKPGYNPKRVIVNNARRALWNVNLDNVDVIKENIFVNTKSISSPNKYESKHGFPSRTEHLRALDVLDAKAQNKGFPDHETYKNHINEDDMSWDMHSCHVEPCEFCGLISEYCKCETI